VGRVQKSRFRGKQKRPPAVVTQAKTSERLFVLCVLEGLKSHEKKNAVFEYVTEIVRKKWEEHSVFRVALILEKFSYQQRYPLKMFCSLRK